jgi:acetyl-CoA acetyltransferase
VLVTAAARAAKEGWKPLAVVRSWAAVGCDPTVMGIGPVPAIQKAMVRTNLSLDQIDLVEINEAFAPQLLACAKDLGLDAATDASKLNLDGGAIAVGHPLAASGARITSHLLYALRQRKKSLAVGSACIGGGQGIAVVIEGE